MKSLFLFVFVALFLNACSKSELTEMIPDSHSCSDTSNQREIRFLALGDSYTIGHAVDISERWPVQLADSLTEAGFFISDVQIIAQTGWTTGELIAALNSQDPQGPFDLVSLLIGVNNQYRHLDTGSYRNEFRILLQRAISLAGDDPENVIVVSIPDYGVTPFAQNMNPEQIAGEIDAFNAIKYDETIHAGAEFIDITPVSREAGENPELIAFDELHPSGKMYAEWVKLIYPVACNLLLDR